MFEATALARYGLLLVFVDVLVGQAGLPIPALPVLLACGALAARGEISLTLLLPTALHASRGRVAGVDGAAQALGVAPSTLESRIQRLGIDKYAFRRRSPSSLFPLLRPLEQS